MDFELLALLGSLLWAVPAVAALYARPGRADGRIGLAVGVLAVLLVVGSIVARRLWPEPPKPFQLVVFRPGDLALMGAGLGSNGVGGLIVGAGMFGIAPRGSHGWRLLAAWVLLDLPLLVGGMMINAGVLWLALFPTLALGLVTFWAPKPKPDQGRD
jgi:hypothetical protein